MEVNSFLKRMLFTLLLSILVSESECLASENESIAKSSSQKRLARSNQFTSQLTAKTILGEREVQFRLESTGEHGKLSVQTSSGQNWTKKIKSKDVLFITKEFEKLKSVPAILSSECLRNNIQIAFKKANEKPATKRSCLTMSKSKTDPYIRFANILTLAVL